MTPGRFGLFPRHGWAFGGTQKLLLVTAFNYHEETFCKAGFFVFLFFFFFHEPCNDNPLRWVVKERWKRRGRSEHGLRYM